MEKEKLIALADKYLRGETTPEEQMQLHAWFDAWQDDEEFISVDEPILKEDIRKRILSKLQQTVTIDTPVINKPLVSFRKKIIWAAASVLLIGFAAVIYFLNTNLSKDKNVVHSPSSPVQDLAPGGDRAVLTLADGSTIVLDSAENGNLTKQGGVNVVKKEDGQLIYSISNESAVSQEILYNTISTPRGGQYQLTLPDGTKVWLNAETSLKYPTVFNDAGREVQLTGEAYFEVATAVSNNKKIPFRVHTSSVDINVLGTHFNINAYADESDVKTTLVEGKVYVNATRNSAYSTVLAPGEQASWQEAGSSMKLIKDADIEQVLAWKNGYFKFQGTELKSIMRQVGRWYDVEVVYENNVEKETFSGDMPRAKYASEVFNLLELTKTVKFNIDGKKVIIKAVKK